MVIVFWLGTALGFAVGAIHAGYIISTQFSLPGPNATALALYRALWALALWTVFGSYLLVLWISGFVLRALFDRASGGEGTA